MYAEVYPNFHVTFVKNKRISEVTPVRLKDMGLPYDVDTDVQFGNLNKQEAECLIDEFVYLIDELIPRSIQDLFYKVGLEPCDAYWKAYSEAVKRMQLEVIDDRFNNKYGQFVDFVDRGIVKRINDGMSLHEIYETTCVTKTQICEAIDSYRTFLSVAPNEDRWILISLELAAFKLNYKYKRMESLSGDDKCFDLLLYDEKKVILAILYICDNNYWSRNKNELIYHVGDVPVLTIDEEEILDIDFDTSLTAIISKAVQGIEAVKTHNMNRLQYWKDIQDEEDSWQDV